MKRILLASAIVAALVGSKIGKELWLRRETDRCVTQIDSYFREFYKSLDTIVSKDDDFGLDDCCG